MLLRISQNSIRAKKWNFLAKSNLAQGLTFEPARKWCVVLHSSFQTNNTTSRAALQMIIVVVFTLSSLGLDIRMSGTCSFVRSFLTTLSCFLISYSTLSRFPAPGSLFVVWSDKRENVYHSDSPIPLSLCIEIDFTINTSAERGLFEWFVIIVDGEAGPNDLSTRLIVEHSGKQENLKIFYQKFLNLKKVAGRKASSSRTPILRWNNYHIMNIWMQIIYQ